jgi:hypothetical protein
MGPRVILSTDISMGSFRSAGFAVLLLASDHIDNR